MFNYPNWCPLTTVCPRPAAGGCSDNFVKVTNSSEAGPGQEVARLCGAQEQEITLTLRRQGRAVIEFR